MQYEYTAIVKQGEKEIGRISAFSYESLMEQWHKLEDAVDKFDSEYHACMHCGEPTTEQHSVREAPDDETGHPEWLCLACWKNITETNTP